MFHQRRLYATSIDTRETISCCTPALNCQSEFRLPHPDITAGLTVVVWTGRPQLRFDHGPHSPLVAGFMKSQSATRLLLVSVHPRAVEATSVTPGLLIV